MVVLSQIDRSEVSTVEMSGEKYKGKILSQ